jgi:hypothetical protein
LKIEISFESKSVHFKFYPDASDEKLFNKPIHLLTRGCFFELPFDITADKIHPDLLAFSALLLCYPFVDRQIDFDFEVSASFSSLCERNLGIIIGTKTKIIPSRKIIDGIPALAYSAGVDSSAALALMPNNKVVYFIDRVLPYGKKTLYNKYAATEAFKEVRTKENNAHRIPTDFEYLKSKVGFPVDQLNVDIPHPVAVPALLMADYYGIDSISYGVIMESVYMIGHEKYDDYKISAHYKKWTPFFELTGCELYLPTAGITEVGTAIITEKTRFSRYIRSCMRGDQINPCGKCIKCLRKSLLINTINGAFADISEIEKNMDSNPVAFDIYGQINQHENIYRYISAFLPENKFSKLLKNRLFIKEEDCHWMEGWFPDAIDLVPHKYRIDFLSKLFQYLRPMSEKEIFFVKSWDVDVYRNNDAVALKEWQEYFIDLASPSVKNYINKNFNNFLNNQFLNE